MAPRPFHWALTASALLAFLLIAWPSDSPAAGINLSWDDCGTAGASNKDFACGTNTGAAIMIGSVVAPAGITQLVAVAATLDLWTSPDSIGTSIPDWWQSSAGGCRAGAVTTSFDFVTGPNTCVDPWSGQATGGLDYATGVPSANHAKIRLVGAMPTTSAVALSEGTEYYTFQVTVSYRNTVGVGSCSGCSSPASIALSSLTLAQAGGLNNILLTDVASSNVITWQGGVGLSPGRPMARAVKFGQVRSLYR